MMIGSSIVRQSRRVTDRAELRPVIKTNRRKPSVKTERDLIDKQQARSVPPSRFQ